MSFAFFIKLTDLSFLMVNNSDWQSRGYFSVTIDISN